MSMSEGLPVVIEEQPAAVIEAVFLEDGALNEAYLQARFGIGAEEALQQVAFGAHTGTVAQMLADEKCPVGGIVGDAYAERGIEGVADKFKSLSDLDPRFSVTITAATLQREQVKKK